MPISQKPPPPPRSSVTGRGVEGASRPEANVVREPELREAEGKNADVDRAHVDRAHGASNVPSTSHADAAELADLQAVGATSRKGFAAAFSRMFSFFSAGDSSAGDLAAPKAEDAVDTRSAEPVVDTPRAAPEVTTQVTTQATTQVTPQEHVRPRIEALYADPAFKALYDFAVGASGTIAREHREWDKLAQVRSFAAAVDFVMRGAALPGAPSLAASSAEAPLAARFRGVQEQRAICHLLLLLMPHDDRTERPMLPDGSRGPAQDLFRPLPDAVLARADDGFLIKKGDLPVVSPIFTRHLASPALLDAIFRPGQSGVFLASKTFCPGAFVQDRADKNPPTLDKKQQSGHEGDPIMVRIDDVIERDGVKLARVHVPAQHKVWLDDGGACVRGDEVLPSIDVVLDKSGKPVLGADGRPQPILVPVDHLAKYLLAEGQGARTLSMASEDDRALALCYAQVLKESSLTDANGITKSLFDWLEQADARTPRHDVDRIKEAVRQAAFQSVVRYSTHPRRTHFKLDVDPAELSAVRTGRKPAATADWQVQAFLALEETGIMRDQGNTYEKDKATTAHVHELAWTAQFLRNGFVGGSLDCLGASDAFDKLSKTFLEPIGVVSTTGIAEGHGAALTRVLGQPDESGIVHVGTPMKVKPNELIVGLEMPLASGRGPAAQYMENWGGYLRISGIVGRGVDFAASQAKLAALLEQAP